MPNALRRLTFIAALSLSAALVMLAGCSDDGAASSPSAGADADAGELPSDVSPDGGDAANPGDTADAGDTATPGDPGCGNAVLEAGEECDDGNDRDYDGCLSTCVLAACEGGDDADGDTVPDRCDACPGLDDADPVVGDPDRDRLCGAADICPVVFDPGQADSDGDGLGDACELLDLSRSYMLLQTDTGGLTEAGDLFGAALATGDFDDDGFADLVVGVPGENGSGVIYVFRGGAGGLGSGRWWFQDEWGSVDEPDDDFGVAVTVGDFDGDGYDDVAAGGPGENGDVGAVHVLRGSDTGLNGETDAVAWLPADLACGGDLAGSRFGEAVAAVDLNGDGASELVIGSPGVAGGTGAICVVPGDPGGLVADSGTVYQLGDYPGLDTTAASPGDLFGATLARVTVFGGGGGPEDLAVAAPGAAVGASGSNSGVVQVWGGTADPTAGPLAWFDGAVELTQAGAGGTAEAGDGFGSSLTAVGDAVVVGAPGEVVESLGAGVFVGFGGTDGDTGAAATGAWHDQSGSLGGAESNSEGDLFGAALASGDFNGDGRPDLAVGAPGKGPLGGPAASGMVALYATRGPVGASWTPGPGEILVQEEIGGASESGDRMGAALAAADFDGDGADDLAISGPGEAPYDDPAGGIIWVVPGNLPQTGLTLGPLVGAVTDHSVMIWARAEQQGVMSVAWRLAGSSDDWTETVVGALEPASDLTGVALLDGLPAATEIEYVVRLDGQDAAAASMRTLPTVGEPAVVRFAYGADLRFSQRPYTIFDQVAASAPDFMILGGDLIYADDAPKVSNDAESYFARYRLTWTDAAMSAALAVTPTLMQWDDHELNNDWYPGMDGRYEAARQAFDAYCASHNPDPIDPGALYYTFDAAQVSFFVMDNRSHRSPNWQADGPDKSMLGGAQLAALLTWVDTSPAVFKVIVSSVPFHDHSTTYDDSWNGTGNSAGAFWTERQLIFDHITDNAVDNVLLLSGDQHWTGVFQLSAAADPYVMYEFMPTPLATTNRDAPSDTAGEGLYVGDTHLTFGMFVADTTVSPATLRFEAIDAAGAVRYALDLDADDIGL